MKQAPSGQRIKLLDGDGFLPRPQVVNPIKKKAIRTGRIALQSRDGVRPAGEPMASEALSSSGVDGDNAIRIGPLRSPSIVAGPQRPSQVWVNLEQEPALTFHRLMRVVQQAVENRQIVFRVVNGLFRNARRRPA